MTDFVSSRPVPFLKWVGGKRQLLPVLRGFYPESFSSYVEPFIGGGAVLFDLLPHSFVVNDINSDLINVYNVVKNDVDGLVGLLEVHKRENSQDYYLRVRALDRDDTVFGALSDVEKAARFIYLNRTGFNGLYRVNSRGQVNVPYGHYKNPLIVDEVKLRNVSSWLNTVDGVFKVSDYGDVLSGVVGSHNFVYLDPPYVPLSATSNFVSYSKEKFNFDDQVRLVEEIERLDSEGNFILLSNSDNEITRELYKNFHVESVSVQRSVGSSVASRGKVSEIIVVGKTLKQKLETK